MSVLKGSFGNKLRLARNLKGLTLQELGDEVHATRQFINQLESGAKLPTDDLLVALSETLSVTKEFFNIELSHEVTPEKCHFRKRKTTKMSLATQVASYGTIFDSFIDLLQVYIDFPSTERLDLLSRLDFNGEDTGFSKQEIEFCANEFRKSLNLGTDTPIDSVTKTLEHCGVFLTTFKGVSDKVDALSFSSKYHVVLRNTAKESVSRQRFDLSHELGHLILHQGVQTGEGRYEAEADYFASCFLFPTAAFMNEFKPCLSASGRFNWRKILQLKLRWKVSQRAIIYRANSLGLINARQYRAANIHLSSSKLSDGSSREELDDQMPLEKPAMVEAAIRAILKKTGMSFEALSNALGLNGNYLSDLLDLPFNVDRVDRVENVLAFKPKAIQ